MGVRIEAFVVDVVLLDRLLDRPLWRILADARQTPPNDDFYAIALEPNTRYRVTPDRRVFRTISDKPSTLLTDDELSATHDLQCLAREYLSSSCPIPLIWLMRILPTLDGAPYARTITSGHRRWWIGSLLTAAENVWHTTAPFNELAGYLARILRGWNCDYPLKRHDAGPQPGDFPVLPVDQADITMAVLNEAECLHLVELLELLIQCNPVFGKPLLKRRDPEGDNYWDEWVRTMVGQFLQIPRVALSNMRLVTFIG